MHAATERAVRWAWWGPAAWLVAAARRYRRPPLLVLSMPRSGSSWLAATIGDAPDAAYLREPLTEQHARRDGGPTYFEVDPDAPPAAYEATARLAFGGVPRFGAPVVQDSNQWHSRDAGRRVVIKEVNPLAIRWLLARHDPRVIYLVRHPAPVAASIARQGWTGHAYTERLLPGRRSAAEHEDAVGSGFYARNGALQALAVRETLDVLRSRPADTWRLVTYEELCHDPAAVCRPLFDFAGLTWNDAVAASLAERTATREPTSAGAYTLVRDSASMVDRWREEMDPADIAEVRRGYLLLDPPLYGADAW